MKSKEERLKEKMKDVPETEFDKRKKKLKQIGDAIREITLNKINTALEKLEIKEDYKKSLQGNLFSNKTSLKVNELEESKKAKNESKSESTTEAVSKLKVSKDYLKNTEVIHYYEKFQKKQTEGINYDFFIMFNVLLAVYLLSCVFSKLF